ncbi:MAG: serine hydrolase domain-containing protein, partial [Actinomycetota bacterium]
MDPVIARFVRTRMRATGTPGVAVGVLHRGRASASGFGITSIAAPAPVDEATLFQVGSTGKTFTATAVMKLVEMGELDLDAPVRRYLRDLKLKDPDVAKKVTLRHLLTHTGGWAGDFFDDTGRGDDALCSVVELLRKVPQLTPLGSTWHYNNAGFYIAGRVLEKVVGRPYERVITELLLDPLGMSRSFYFAEEAIVYRVAAGHIAKGPRSTAHEIGQPWALMRSAGPAGGLISDVVDQLRWARFHMGDGRTPKGARLLKRSTLRQMQRPQAPAGNIADSVGISWLLSDFDGARLVSHGGTMGSGQLSAFVMVPKHDFAVTVLTNSSRGLEVHGPVVHRALDHYLGLKRRLPQPMSGNGTNVASYAGRYVDAFKTVAIDLAAKGTRLRAEFVFLKTDEAPRLAPSRFAFFEADKVIIQGGRLDGSRAEFLRDERGRVRFMRFGGRLFRKSRAHS